MTTPRGDAWIRKLPVTDRGWVAERARGGSGVGFEENKAAATALEVATVATAATVAEAAATMTLAIPR